MCVFQVRGALLPHVRPRRHLLLHRCLLHAVVSVGLSALRGGVRRRLTRVLFVVAAQVEPAGTGPSGRTHALVCVAHGRRRDHLRLQLPREVRKEAGGLHPVVGFSK